MNTEATEKTCKDCGQTLGTSYSSRADGNRCLPCSGLLELAEMATATEFYGYLSPTHITTWGGTPLATVTSRHEIRHNMAGTITVWRAKDAQGHNWYGRGTGDAMFTRMHRAKH